MANSEAELVFVSDLIEYANIECNENVPLFEAKKRTNFSHGDFLLHCRRAFQTDDCSHYGIIIDRETFIEKSSLVNLASS